MSDSEQIEMFLNYLREVQLRYSAADDELFQTNNETQDILHRLELYSDGYHRTAAIAKMLQEVRRRRRKAKEQDEVCTPICDWISKNQAVIKGLERLLGEVRKVENRQKNRMYAPKTNILEEK